TPHAPHTQTPTDSRKESPDTRAASDSNATSHAPEQQSTGWRSDEPRPSQLRPLASLVRLAPRTHHPSRVALATHRRALPVDRWAFLARLGLPPHPQQPQGD